MTPISQGLTKLAHTLAVSTFETVPSGPRGFARLTPQAVRFETPTVQHRKA